jgi:hypothetical protein
MIRHAELVKPVSRLESLIRETDELISIFVASVKTTQLRAKRNQIVSRTKSGEKQEA